MNRFGVLFGVNHTDVNNNNNNSRGMGVKGKKCKFASDLEVFGKEAGGKNYIWTSVKMSCKKSKGTD